MNEIKEKELIRYKGLTINKSTFSQFREINQKQIEAWQLLEDKQVPWEGYIVQSIEGGAGTIQIFWFIAQILGSVSKARESEVWWTLNGDKANREAEIENLKRLLPQVFYF